MSDQSEGTKLQGFFVGALTGLAMASIGFAFVAALGDPHYRLTKPVLVSAPLLTKSALEGRLPVMDVLVRFETKEAIHAICGDDAYACTSHATAPCTVHFPAGEAISFSPLMGSARWSDSFDSAAIPHEILHCVYPNWHDPFTKARAEVKRMMKENGQ